MEIQNEGRVHLVILQHGLNGFASDMDALGDRLIDDCLIQLFIPESNQSRTNDGIENGGQRLFQCVTEKIKLVNATHISFIGSSVGGLYLRYVVGLLFEADFIPRVKPVTFITISTPHFGSRNSAPGFAQDIKSLMAKLLLSTTGKDLMLLHRHSSTLTNSDTRPILLELLDDKFVLPLKLFDNLIAYSRPHSSTSEIIKSSNNMTDLEKELNLAAADITIEGRMAHSFDLVGWKRIVLPALGINESDSNYWSQKENIGLIDGIIGYLRSCNPSNSQPKLVVPESKVHLVVLIHGLDGFSSDMEYIAKRLQKRFTTPIKTFAPECNHGRTHDGILKGAQRILESVEEILKVGNIKYLSIVGHSLGGLYARCLVGLLFQKNITPINVIPVNFITLATPHLGSREHGKILGDKFTSLVLGSVIGLTGKELMLADTSLGKKVPFLLELSEELYTNPLRSFHRLVIYSNTRFDVSVHYSTAAIRRHSFVTHVDLSTIAIPAILTDDSIEIVPGIDELLDPDAFELKMLDNLVRLPWKRYAVIPSRPMLAHIDIIIKSVFWNLKHGFPIIAHLLDQFRLNYTVPKIIEAPAHVDNGMQGADIDNSMHEAHLIVLVHGLDSSSHDLIPLADAIRDTFHRPEFKIIIPTFNDGKTGDGILNGCTRLYCCVKQEICQSKPTKISFISDSIGGLYSRMLLNLLSMENLIPQIKPVNFVTINTPHLGFRKNLNDWLSSKYLRTLMSPTGRELNFLDTDNDENILISLASEEYIDALSLFPNLIMYANTKAAQHTYYSTCAATLSEQPDIKLTHHKNPKIIPVESGEIIRGDSLEAYIALNLGRLKWKRFAIDPATSVLSNQFEYWNATPTHPIISHIIRQLMK